MARPRPAKHMAELILKEIKRRGGMRARDIVRFVFEHNCPDEEFLPETRYYTNALYGTGTHVGILYSFCEKRAGGYWVVVKPIKRPFYKQRQSSLRWSYARAIAIAQTKGKPKPPPPVDLLIVNEYQRKSLISMIDQHRRMIAAKDARRFGGVVGCG